MSTPSKAMPLIGSLRGSRANLPRHFRSFAFYRCFGTASFIVLLAATWLTMPFSEAAAQTPDAFNPEVDNAVYALASLPDGKVLVGGDFTRVGDKHRNGLARFNADGSLDEGFNPSADAAVYCLAIQKDDKILVGGDFTTLNGQTRKCVARLNADGTLDDGFNPGADNDVVALAVQDDGKILLGGAFNMVGGQAHTNLVRLNADGSVDADFNPLVRDSSYPFAQSKINSLALQEDGKILVGGRFTKLGGLSRMNMGRLDADGSVDSTFDPNPDSTVYSLATQPDGKILVGGDFLTIGGGNRIGLARLNSDGTADAGFSPAVGDGIYASYVYSMVMQADGKILIGGGFNVVAGQARTNLARLNVDGTVDASFSPAANNKVYSLTLQADGKVLVGGTFTTLGGSARSNIARLNNSDPASDSIICYDSTITWLRGGTAPEISHASFEVSPDGRTWSYLGLGVRAAHGWQITSAPPPVSAFVRARGFTAGGRYNGSGGLIETLGRFGVPAITSQSIDQSCKAGNNIDFNVSVSGTVPFSYQWWKDDAMLADIGNVAGAAADTLTLTNAQAKDVGRYFCVISNVYGSVTSAVAKLTLLTPGLPSVDNFGPALNSTVYCTAVQPDGKILIGGSFTTLGGKSCSRIGRLNAEGTIDPTFNPNANGTVYAITVQPDGKILLGGSFTTIGGISRSRIARLNSDGTLDPGFSPAPSSDVTRIVLQPDGKILIAGSFDILVGYRMSRYLARLNADGSADETFDVYVNYTGPNTIALQPDGKILVGGYFTLINSLACTNIGRVYSDGTADAGFLPGADNAVSSIIVQPDSKILVAGSFMTLGGQSRMRLGRLKGDGTLDTSFNASADGNINCLALQTDGKILVGGSFASLNGQARSRLGRLNPDGTLDNSFDLGASNIVYSLSLQENGQVLVGGSFTNLGGQSVARLGRLNNTDPAIQNLTHDNSILSWARAGASPGIARATFDYCADGRNWTNLGIGSLVAGGWQLTGVSIPRGSSIRAFGQTVGGYRNGSTWLTQTIMGVPYLVTPPFGTTVNFSSNAAFTVVAAGDAPFSFQWFKDGLTVDSGTNAMLVLTNVTGGDAGSFMVVVSNSSGCATSAPAMLTINDPLIVSPPVSQTKAPGDSVTFSVTAMGTPSFKYQWRKEGVALTDATNSTLTLSNLQLSDDGNYDVLVSGPWGTSTSRVAVLSVSLSVADAFNPGASDSPYAFVTQPDGKILVGGGFTNLAGQSCPNLGRLNSDGTLDSSFSPGVNGVVFSILQLPDGKILVGGGFSSVGAANHNCLARLNSDGTTDASFTLNASSGVYCLALQADGKILIGGSFTNLGGINRNYLARISADGAVDPSFNPVASDWVYSLALQPDGRILVGGNFTNLAGMNVRNCGRINGDGTADTNFNPGATATVYSLALQPDNKILVGGIFSALGGTNQNCLARLNADGTADPTFNLRASGAVYCFAVQADEKLLISGYFTNLGGLSRSRVARVNSDGTVDTTFNPGASGTVYSLGLQPNGDILVGGAFSTLGGQSRANIGRLNSSGSATQSLFYDGSTLTWQRSGTSPEFSRATFEFATNGGAWTLLGSASWIKGGWQLGGLNLPANVNARARGYATGGRYNGSGCFFEKVVGPPSIQKNPQSVIRLVGSSASYSVSALSDMPLGYRWMYKGTNLADNNRVIGAATENLCVNNIQAGDAGEYQVIVTNALGSVMSTSVTLTVVPPHALSLLRGGSENFHLRFPTVAGLSYDMQQSTNLVDWFFMTNWTPGNDGIMELEKLGAQGNHYYRLRFVLP